MLKLVIALHIRNLLLQLLYLLLLENSLVLDWHNLDEILYVVVPVIEHSTGELTTSIEIMLTNQLMQLLAIGAVFHEVNLHHIHVTEVIEVVVLIPYVGNTTTHTSGDGIQCTINLPQTEKQAFQPLQKFYSVL